jgi:hypothetical protein
MNAPPLKVTVKIRFSFEANIKNKAPRKRGAFMLNECEFTLL